MKVIAALLSLVILTQGLPVSPAWGQQNPFSARPPSGERAAPSENRPAASPLEQAAADRAADSEPLITLPAPVRSLFRWIADQQRSLNAFMSGKLRESKADGGWAAAAALLAASFLYGVLHAAGPGHGKLVVASYFTARKAPLATGIMMGTIIAATQAVVAILAVGVLAVILGRRQMDVVDDVNLLEIVSYGIIFLIGGYMTYCAVRGREAFGHDHGPPASTFDEPPAPAPRHDGHQHDHHHGHHHDQAAPGHDHGDHHHGRDDHHHDGTAARQTWLARTARAWFGRYGEVLAVGVVSGIRPCSGSILVLLFALANGVFMLGVAAALLIALGVTITISALGIGTIALRRAVAGGDAPASPARARLGRALAVAGSAGVMVLGGLLLGGALQTYGIV
jgi:ABC-type nickel/cobalt efflux system permease component RcnA